MTVNEPAPEATVKALLAQEAWVRALARQLVGEEGADDVVQETWLTALRRPPWHQGNLRSWLAGVTRNVVLHREREEARRRRRERAAAVREAEPSTADVVERARLLRELVDRVLALDESSRDVLLLGFFDGLPPR